MDPREIIHPRDVDILMIIPSSYPQLFPFLFPLVSNVFFFNTIITPMKNPQLWSNVPFPYDILPSGKLTLCYGKKIPLK